MCDRKGDSKCFGSSMNGFSDKRHSAESDVEDLEVVILGWEEKGNGKGI